MLFITKRKHNRLLREQKGSRMALADAAYTTGYLACLADNGHKGFITGKRCEPQWRREIEALLKAKGM